MDEPKFKLKVLAHIVVDGLGYQPGDEISLPERQALGLVGEGEAQQIPDDAQSSTQGDTQQNE